MILFSLILVWLCDKNLKFETEIYAFLNSVSQFPRGCKRKFEMESVFECIFLHANTFHLISVEMVENTSEAGLVLL